MDAYNGDGHIQTRGLKYTIVQQKTNVAYIPLTTIAYKKQYFHLILL